MGKVRVRKVADLGTCACGAKLWIRCINERSLSLMHGREVLIKVDPKVVRVDKRVPNAREVAKRLAKITVFTSDPVCTESACFIIVRNGTLLYLIDDVVRILTEVAKVLEGRCPIKGVERVRQIDTTLPLGGWGHGR